LNKQKGKCEGTMATPTLLLAPTILTY